MSNAPSAEEININYEYFEENRYSIPEFQYKNTNYNGICNNGFIKLRTVKGNDYWLTQNTHEHLTPDWKLHFSVHHDDVKKAWNLLTQVFIEQECWEGMKVLYLKENTLVAKGREITVYIYRHCIQYGNEFSMNDERREDFWLQFLLESERILEANKIIPNGCAEGDFKLGKYSSLRNEAFIPHSTEDCYIYPPDESGWNAANHKLPFDLFKIRDILNGNEIRRKHTSSFVSKILKISVIILIWSYLIYKHDVVDMVIL